jgi:putative membrane protein
MTILAGILVAIVALIHAYIVVLEMFLWTRPSTLRSFNTTPEIAETTKVLAGNQGLYNGFLAAGLIWGLVHPDPTIAFQVKVFFLACVFVAGVYGALTVKRSILYVQSLPALLALLAVWFAGA